MTSNIGVVFNSVFQHAQSISILVLDLSGMILDANFGIEKNLGFKRESLINKNFSLLFVEKDSKNDLPELVLKKTIAEGSFRHSSYLLDNKGTRIWTHCENIYIKNKEGRESIIKIIQNIHEEKILEERLKRKNKEQEKIIKDNDTFIYTASHDLKAPLSNFEGLINALKDSYDDPNEVKYLVPLLEETVGRLNDKIDELSATGREQFAERKKKSKVEFQKIFDDVLLDLDSEIKSSNAEIFSDFSRANVTDFSKKNIKSILQNLLSNSLKYRSPDRLPQILVKTDKTADGYLLIVIKDNGIGIREEERERIFEMYHRVDSHVDGTGVGLAIVKNLVENMGGKIELETEVGDGSIFRIYLKAF